jgi:uncharacterized protein (TIGR02266 family)
MSLSAASARKIVLVADDTAFVRDRFKAAIEEAGHRAGTASGAQELLACIRTEGDRVDLIVVDLRLSGSKGLEMICAIRAIDGGRLPILVCSGTIASAAEVKALAALGIAGYINEYATVQHILPAISPHLFPDTSNRRGSPRVVLGVPVAYRVGNTIAAALTLNLSHGGVAIRTAGPLDKYEHVRLRFRLPGAARDLGVGARVAWTDRRVGMGLRFEDMSPGDRSAIGDFVDCHFFTNRKA